VKGPIEEVSQLREELGAGRWVPSDGEKAAAQAVSELPALSVVGLRLALNPARTTRSRYVIAMEGVAMVLSLPEVHEEHQTRERLVHLAEDLSREIAAA
jgi:hypothetical protein